MSHDPQGRIAIVTVHGTGDTAAEPEGPPDGDHWFQSKSKFNRLLKERLAGHGVDAEIIPHLWSGDNSATARERGASTLSKLIKRLARSYAGVHIIGHSHGGNVANDAACMLNWSAKQRRPQLSSITTVGTPFFRSRVTTGDRIGAWIFAMVVVLSLLVIPAVMLFAGGAVTSALSDVVNMPDKVPDFNAARANFEVEESVRSVAQPISNWVAANGFPVASALALLFMVPLAVRGIGRIERAGRRKRDEPSLFSIWHPNDEAIAFLTRLESVVIEPFPRWSLFRGSRTGGIVWGVRAIIYLNLVGAGVLAADSFFRGINVFQEPFQSYGIYLLLIGVAGAPLVFAAAYILYRLFAALVLELWLRGLLNNSIGGALIAIAFGRDGDHRIDKVSPHSHYYASREEIVSGEVAERMLAQSAEASQRLFDKYRAALFSVQADESNAVGELTKDSMTWASLIHTTYFRQPEIAASIGDYIAGVAKGAKSDV
jgi:hypothetical protein